MRGKRLLPPVISSSRASQKTSRTRRHSNGDFESERRSYDALIEVERALGASVATVARRVHATNFKKSRKPKQTIGQPEDDPQLRFTCAIDVVQYGVQQGWIL